MANHLVRCVLASLAALPLAAQQSQWWSHQPLQRPAVPAIDGTWGSNAIDAFVLEGLRARGFAPAPEADRHTLLRRVTYDLTGLPPTGVEIAAFVADTSPAAYEKVIDRLLASPQHGVKWAQHWLDVVRYADTDGYERDRKKPEIWRYRDWVVDAINADLPWAEFVSKQLAGDELPDARVADLTATGFYRLGIWDDEPTDREQHRYDDLDGMADTTARAFLAVSMGCARCHDHKKDPLSQQEYHGFLAFFENVKPYDLQAQVVPEDGARERFDTEMAAFRGRRDAVRAQLTTRLSTVWDALSAVQQRERMEQARAALLASYTGDRGSAAQLLDDVGERHGKVEGQVVQVDGHRGQALRFDGDDAVVLERIVQGTFSVAFWLRSDQRGPGRGDEKGWFHGAGLVDAEVPGIVADWGISWYADGRVLAGTGDPETFLASAPGNHDGQWHHVAFTRDQASGRIALYVDGVLQGFAKGSTAELSAPPRLVIGRLQPGGHGYRGDLDEIQFYGRALAAAEVAALAFAAADGIAGGADLTGEPALRAFSELQAPALATTQVLAVNELGAKGPDAFVRIRGNVHAKGAKVELGFPKMLGGGTPVVQPGKRSSGRRSALARWIVEPGNRATWRVLANRLWQHHFGRGLVRSSSDFGRLGDLPTHPQLLDWLACEVLERGQSQKAMHRLLVSSATYRMASTAEPNALASDAQNDAFWRFDRRRLTAEEVRDSLLVTAGDVNLAIGGPSVFPPLPEQVLATASRPDDAWGSSTAEEAVRRSLYVHVKRSLAEPLLAGFDRADTDSSCPVRFATVQPTQALTMLNGDFAHVQASKLAARLQREASGLRAQLAHGLELVTQRPARAADIDRLAQLAAELQRDHGRDEAQALQRCCLVLLNCNEFLFLD